VFRSSAHIYVQVIDDRSGQTLASASSVEPTLKAATRGNNIKGATLVGETIAARLKDKGITAVVFDRNGFLYHGRVKAVADAARSAGLRF
jgi:large subunit ribosomal protein L18